MFFWGGAIVFMTLVAISLFMSMMKVASDADDKAEKMLRKNNNTYKN